MRLAVVVALAACASRPPPRNDLPPFGGQNMNPCGGADRPLRELTVEHGVVPGAAESSSGELEVISCCRGVLFVDGELVMQFYEDRPAKLDVGAGKRRLAIEIDGHRRWEQDITIAAGDRVVVKPRL